MHFTILPLLAAIELPAIAVTLIGVVLPLLVAPISMQLGRAVLNATAWVDALPSLVKQIVSAIITTLLTVAALKIDPAIPNTLGGVDTAAIAALLNNGIAYLLHHVIKVKEAAAPVA